MVSGEIKEKKKNNDVELKKLRYMFECLTEELTLLCLTIEVNTLTSSRKSDGKSLSVKQQEFKDIIKKINEYLKKISFAIKNCKDVQEAYLPVSLIEHIDMGKSPNTWIKTLANLIKFENNKTEKQLTAIKKLGEKIRYNLDESN